ncbi:MAG: hypothetical protein ACFB9M_21080 [Myxococcota bacterium]
MSQTMTAQHPPRRDVLRREESGRRRPLGGWFGWVWVAVSVACGTEMPMENGPSTEPERVEPKMVMSRTDICLNVEPFPVADEVRAFGFVLLNTGREDLIIRGVSLSGDARSAYTLVSFEDTLERDCIQGACRIPYNDFAGIKMRLVPPERGWDAVSIHIESNDPDWQDQPLTVRLLSAAMAPSDPPAFDPGPRPVGTECFCVFPVPEECAGEAVQTGGP